MNLLMVGTGAGSWQVRGVQLGQAMGATLTLAPSADQLRWADIVVLVKRAAFTWAPFVHAHGKPLVWDALDCWAQPLQNSLTEDEARKWMDIAIRKVKPTLVIGATQAMADDVGGVYLPHHSWPDLKPSPIREAVRVVAYQGAEHYLGRWYLALEIECRARGWMFLVNPDDVREADILVAFRDAEWDGWMCRQWKSGVKYVNARAAGRPILTQPSAAFNDIRPAGGIVESPADLAAELESWSNPVWRDEVRAECAAHPPTSLAMIADQYLNILQTRVMSCTV